MYSDIDIDANDMETEFQAAFEDLLFFINAYISNKGGGNYDGEEVNIIFNRDILISESEVIENCAKSVGILSDETIISQHPWVDDVELELKRLEEQKKKNMEEYAPFNTEGGDGDDPESNPSD
jgi:SPP1 family phage portal protein